MHKRINETPREIEKAKKKTYIYPGDRPGGNVQQMNMQDSEINK